MADPIRNAALSILNRLENTRHTLDRILDPTIEKQGIVSRRDINFIYALTHGTLRWRNRLDWIIDRVARTPTRKMDPRIRNILRLALFQILYLDRVPSSAAVNTAVDLARAAAGPKITGFVNAVLRNAIRKHDTFAFPDPAADPVAALAVRMSFPPWMIARWIDRMGYDETRAMCRAINSFPPLTLRTNTLATDRGTLAESLRAGGESPQPTACSPLGLRLVRARRTVGRLPGFRTGKFQIQDEAAQLVTLLLDPRPGERILDACAGLGGKTGHIGQAMENRGQITAADHRSARLSRLDAEMKRLGITIVSSRRIDLTDAAAVARLGVFDRILLDAPCSGLGVLRRHPDAKWRHAPEIFSEMARRQYRLLTRLAPLVKPGGTMVYAVCSTEPEENEMVIDRFLNACPKFRLTSAAPFLPPSARHLVTAEGYFRTEIHRHEMDGFFAVRFCDSSVPGA